MNMWHRDAIHFIVCLSYFSFLSFVPFTLLKWTFHQQHQQRPRRQMGGVQPPRVSESRITPQMKHAGWQRDNARWPGREWDLEPGAFHYRRGRRDGEREGGHPQRRAAYIDCHCLSACVYVNLYDWTDLLFLEDNAKMRWVKYHLNCVFVHNNLNTWVSLVRRFLSLRKVFITIALSGARRANLTVWSFFLSFLKKNPLSS